MKPEETIELVRKSFDALDAELSLYRESERRHTAGKIELRARIAELEAEVKRYQQRDSWARGLIEKGVWLMSSDQVAQWAGARAWQETDAAMQAESGGEGDNDQS